MNQQATANPKSYQKIFRRTGILACSSVFLLFLLGGLVRVTGSGMGCPDWPKCFGLIAPPTCECQLPENYKEVFLQKRLAKVQRFAKALDAVGLHKTARKLRENKTILLPEEFNATKAWIEYINRLFGVLAGLFSLLFFILALRYYRDNGVLKYVALGFVMLLLNAWLGSVVVATNLLPGLVSVHFLFSFLCMFFFMKALHLQKPFANHWSVETSKYWLLLFVITMAIVLLGTWSRERVELLEANGTLEADNMLNLAEMGIMFAIHRFLPGAALLLGIWLYYKFKSTHHFMSLAFFWFSLLAFVQIALGAVNTVYILPAWSQVVHIVLGSAMPVFTYYFLLKKDKSQI